MLLDDADSEPAVKGLSLGRPEAKETPWPVGETWTWDSAARITGPNGLRGWKDVSNENSRRRQDSRVEDVAGKVDDVPRDLAAS